MGNIASSGIGAGAPSPGSPPALYDIDTQVVVAAQPPLNPVIDSGAAAYDGGVEWRLDYEGDGESLILHPAIVWDKTADIKMVFAFRLRDGEETPTWMIPHEETDFLRGDKVIFYTDTHNPTDKATLTRNQLLLLNVSGFEFILPFVNLAS